MRHQAGAVSVIAVGREGDRTGLTATAVCSLSDTPPMLLVCVNRNASAHAPILSERAFSVNVLDAGQDAIASTFSGRTDLAGEARFVDDGWGTLQTGAPILTSALAGIDCRLGGHYETETHSIFIGHVVDAMTRDDGDPLVYFRSDYWTLADR